MLERLTTWSNRIHLSRVARAPLGFGTEYWDLNPKHYEGWEELRDRRAAHGLKSVKRDLAYDLASHLLNDLIVAAGGVERAITRLRETLVLSNNHVRDNGLRAQGGVPLNLSHEV